MSMSQPAPVRLSEIQGHVSELEYWLDPAMPAVGSDRDALELSARQVIADQASLLTLTRALRDALEPFAKLADYWERADVDTMLTTERVMVDVADLRRTRALLEQIQE